jgi:hypothetical protein
VYRGRERATQKEPAKEAAAKKEPTKPDKNQRTKAKREHTRRRILVKSTKGNTPIAHRYFLSIQPLVTAMRHEILNNLGNLTIPRAGSGMITKLLRAYGQR